MNEHFINKIRELLRFEILEMREFAPGFVAVKLLSVGGHIIYFDRWRFRPKIYQKWGGRICPKKLKELGLGVYYERQSFPMTASF